MLARSIFVLVVPVPLIMVLLFILHNRAALFGADLASIESKMMP